MRRNEKSFIDYLNAVDDLLESHFGFTSSNADMEMIASCQEEGATPEECCEMMGKKLDV